MERQDSSQSANCAESLVTQVDIYERRQKKRKKEGKGG